MGREMSGWGRADSLCIEVNERDESQYHLRERVG